MIWEGILCSLIFRGFPRSYHETLPYNIPSEDYYEIHVGRSTEETKFESSFLCSQAFLMSGNNLYFQIQYHLTFSLSIQPQIDIQQKKIWVNLDENGQSCKWFDSGSFKGTYPIYKGSYHLVFIWCKMPKAQFILGDAVSVAYKYCTCKLFRQIIWKYVGKQWSIS